MCLSRLGQIIYGALSLVAVALVLAAMFTSGWKDFRSKVLNLNVGMVQQLGMSVGIFPFACVGPSLGQSYYPGYQVDAYGNVISGNTYDYCRQWWLNQPDWMKVVIAGMVIGLILTALSFIWNLATFWACCCEGHIQKPLPAIAGCAAASLAVAVGVYGFKNQASIGELLGPAVVVNSLESLSSVSYSFYMACGALICCIANVVVGTIIVFLSDKCL